MGASAVVFVLLLALLIPAAVAMASAPLDTLQVTIQTPDNIAYQYTLTAYNTSGYQVASFSGAYPEAAFGLPAGTYLVTATAYSQRGYCLQCLMPLSANGTAVPIKYQPPEYGYAVVKLAGPTQVTIKTANSSQAQTVDVPVHVQYVNGSAASGAYVSAYVVGGNYQYSQGWVTYGQTGQGGNFTLVVPQAPIQVNAHLSVPIQLPKNVSVITTDVGGQKVNVTVYWQPSSVYLSGETLILPPETGATITLEAGQQYPYPIYYSTGPSGGVTTITTVTSTAASGGAQAGSPAQTGQISPFEPSSLQLSPTSTNSGYSLALIGEVILGACGAALVAGAVTIFLRRRTQPGTVRQ